MKPFEGARQGIARTFQNIALVRGHERSGQRHDRPFDPYEKLVF